MRMTLHILTFQLADMCNRCECIECDRVNVERKTAHKIAPSCHFYPHWIYINTIIIRCINALFGVISTLDMYMDFPSQYQSERHFRREVKEIGCCRSLLHFAFKFYMNNFLLFIPMFIQSFRCHVFSVSFSFESRKTLYSVRCLYQFALFAYFLSYLTYGKQIKRTSFRLLVGVCVYKLLVANHRHPLTLKCTSMCSAFYSHPEIMNRILARLSDFSVACAYIIDGIPAHSFFWALEWALDARAKV